MSIGRAAQPKFASRRGMQRRKIFSPAPSSGKGVIATSAAFRVDVYELTIYFCAVMLGAFAYVVDQSFTAVANTGVPLLLIAALGWGCLRMAIQQVETILTPTFVMRVAILFYGAIGSLIPIYSNDETKSFIESFFAFSNDELLKYNIVVTLFSIVFSFSADIFRMLSSQLLTKFSISGDSFGIDKSNLSLGVVAFTFLGLGAFSKYFVILPFQFGLLRGTFPLFLAQIALLENIGIFLGLIWAFRNKRFFVPILVGYAIFVSVVGVLTFSKSDVIFPIIMIAAAYVYVQPNLARVALALAAILFSFNFVQPIANHGRAWLNRCCASIDAPAGFGERVDIIANYFNGNEIRPDDNINYAFVRFSYANVGTYVVSARDSGWEGDSLKYLAAVFVPRILWPEKPVLTDIARDLNVAITGNPNSAVAPGFAAEGYWDGGWLGVALMALASGLICYLWSLYSLEVQRVGGWHLFVIVLLGIRVGSRFDGFFVTDLIGPTVYAMVGHIAIMLLNRALAPRY